MLVIKWHFYYYYYVLGKRSPITRFLWTIMKELRDLDFCSKKEGGRKENLQTDEILCHCCLYKFPRVEVNLLSLSSLNLTNLSEILCLLLLIWVHWFFFNKMKNMTWTRESLTALIELYRQSTALWNVKDAQHKNRSVIHTLYTSTCKDMKKLSEELDSVIKEWVKIMWVNFFYSGGSAHRFFVIRLK